jgi:uncharacterized protein (DUF488 family)
MPTLYTIGYGGRHPQHFVTLLTQANIALVCDVRAEPRRAYRGIYTFNPEKGSGPLPRLLAQADIAYEWFPELGNPERGGSTVNRGHEHQRSIRCCNARAGRPRRFGGTQRDSGT